VLSVWAQLDNANEAAAEAFRHAVSLPEDANLEKYLTVHEEDDTWELYYAEGTRPAPHGQPLPSWLLSCRLQPLRLSAASALTQTAGELPALPLARARSLAPWTLGEEEAGMRVFVRTFPVSDIGDDFDEEPAKADYPPPEDEDDEGAPAGAEFEEEEEEDEDEDEEEAEEAGQGLKRKKM